MLDGSAVRAGQRVIGYVESLLFGCEGMLAELQSPCLLETMTRFLEYAKDRFDLLCLLFYSYGGAVAKSGCVAVC